jgi:hypothetical protein
MTGPAPQPAPPPADDRSAPAPGFYGLSRDDLSLLNRIAFAGASLGRVRETRAICAVTRRLVPDHACWAIGEYLCRMSEGRRDAALDWLEEQGLTRDRAWEQAADLLIAETTQDPARRSRIVAKVADRPGGGEVLAALGLAPPATEELSA